MAEKTQYETWREVDKKEAKYMAVTQDGSICYYKSIEDLEWALRNSWYEGTSVTVAKLLNMQITVNE